MREYWIIGAGRFGRKALERLHQRRPADRFVVVDSSRSALEKIRSAGVETSCTDGIDFLSERLVDPGRPDWIVPCLPRHLAFEWIRRRLENTCRLELLPVPDSVRQALPHPFEGRDGALYLSYADFTCPDDCPEPADICTVTGRPRPGTLFRTIAALPPGELRPVVVRSRQLLPGVGGYRPGALFDALAQVRAAAGIVAVATACRCHGVLHVFRLPAPANHENRGGTP
jgi:hypothetical protein